MKKGIIFLIAGIVGAILGVGVFKETKRKKKKARQEGKHVPYGPYEACIKRPLDFILSLIALIVLSPVLLVIAIFVRIKLGSPVVFTQERPGKDEKIFELYKFRTMTEECDENGVLRADEERLTSFGRVLRSSSCDEILECVNILKGDMSIIGPRPLLIRYLSAYTEAEKQRHDVRPGLTGLAQINGRNYLKWDERLSYDVEYVKKITFMRDLKILAKTVLKVLRKDGVATNTDEIDEGYLDEIRGVNIKDVI